MPRTKSAITFMNLFLLWKTMCVPVQIRVFFYYRWKKTNKIERKSLWFHYINCVYILSAQLKKERKPIWKKSSDRRDAAMHDNYFHCSWNISREWEAKHTILFGQLMRTCYLIFIWLPFLWFTLNIYKTLVSSHITCSVCDYSIQIFFLPFDV